MYPTQQNLTFLFYLPVFTNPIANHMSHAKSRRESNPKLMQRFVILCSKSGVSKLFFTEGHIQNNAPKSGPVAKEKTHATPLSCIDVSTSIRLRFLTEYKENTNFQFSLRIYFAYRRYRNACRQYASVGAVMLHFGSHDGKQVRS